MPSKKEQTEPKSKKRNLDVVSTEQVEKKKSKKNNKGDQSIIDNKSCVVYLGHIAHGFYETELRGFFQQFGKVRRLKLFRSKKSGNSRGHAFIQFENNDVAEVVASSLDGYFLSERQLVCHVVPVNKIHEGMFLPPKGQKSVEENDGEVEAAKEEKVEAVDSEKLMSRRTRKQREKQSKLEDLGIDYTFVAN